VTGGVGAAAEASPRSQALRDELVHHASAVQVWDGKRSRLACGEAREMINICSAVRQYNTYQFPDRTAVLPILPTAVLYYAPR
jgi:hypothetical protein